MYPDSSKLNEQSPNHGGRGTFLASLSAMAVLSITSHHHSHRSHNMITMHKSEVVSRQNPAPPQHHLTSFGHGTKVMVRDLFGNMPVRVKQRAVAADRNRAHGKDWEELKREIVALILSWPANVIITIRESFSDRKLLIRPPARLSVSSGVHVSWVCSILSQAALIYSEEKDSWVAVGASTQEYKIFGAISLDPSVSKHVQFFSFGITPLETMEGQSILRDQINRLFLNSAFGNEEETPDLDEAERKRRAQDHRFKGEGYTNKELRGVKKGVDRWPMFYINIQQNRDVKPWNGMDLDHVLDGKSGGLSGIMELLQAMVLEFLTRNHFRPKAERSRRVKPSKSPTKFENSKADTLPLKSDDKPAKSTFKQSATESKTSTRPEFDQFGKNVILPSFRQSNPHTQSSFDTWSRVKSGLAMAKVARPITDSESWLEGSQIQRSSTAPPPSSASSIVSPALQKPLATPLLSKSGKLLRRPFDDLAPRKARILASKIQTPKPFKEPVSTGPDNSFQAENTVLDNDEIVTWINPFTKVKSLVNRRTGLTVSAKPFVASSVTAALTLSARQKSQGIKSIHGTSSLWLNDILQEWDNPVFAPTESAIPQVVFDGLDSPSQELLHGRHHHCSQVDIDRAFREMSAGINGSISKDALRDAEVVSQVDKKFILVKIGGMRDHGASQMLVLIDQHAADERIRIESLMHELCTPSSKASPTKSGILTSTLENPLIFEISSKDIELLEVHQQHFANWGILYTLPAKNTTPIFSSNGKPFQLVAVTSLPPCITERCKIDSRPLIDLIRTEVYKVNDQSPKTPSKLSAAGSWLERVHTCPQGLIDMLNSRACRSAIMFNDELSADQCQRLVQKLSRCLFPFQCAHGRPSLVPLVGLGDSMGGGLRGTGALLPRETDEAPGFGQAFAGMRGRINKGRG